MTIKEIHFNHDRGNGAIPLSHAPGFGRDGQASDITAPEWREGVSEPVAYARGEIRGPVTIKARFINGPPGVRVTIRAVGPIEPGLRSTEPGRMTTPLGDVKPQVIAFDDRGESGLHELGLSGELHRARVGQMSVVWNWQRHVNAETWRTFGTTFHYVSVTLHMPTKPWLKASVEAMVKPFAEALALACHWADGADTLDDSILKVAQAINQHPKLVYHKSGKQFAQDDKFLLSNLLHDLHYASSINIDCQGVANALVTFANLLGANLRVLHLENRVTEAAAFTTNRVLALRGPTWGPQTWKWHELAVDPASPIFDSLGGFLPGLTMVDGQTLDGPEGTALRVYDANLHLNEPAPVFPIGIRLGNAGTTDQEYRDLFISSGTAASATPLAGRAIV